MGARFRVEDADTGREVGEGLLALDKAVDARTVSSARGVRWCHHNIVSLTHTHSTRPKMSGHALRTTQDLLNEVVRVNDSGGSEVAQLHLDFAGWDALRQALR